MENLAGNKFDTIGHERYFETMCFHADPTDKRYKDIDVQKEISFESNWSLNEIDADDKANEMHENVVNEITSGLLIGLTYPTER